jgi:hypothetical protein
MTVGECIVIHSNAFKNSFLQGESTDHEHLAIYPTWNFPMAENNEISW